MICNPWINKVLQPNFREWVRFDAHIELTFAFRSRAGPTAPCDLSEVLRLCALCHTLGRSKSPGFSDAKAESAYLDGFCLIGAAHIVTIDCAF
jgi:hypothetical protein